MPRFLAPLFAAAACLLALGGASPALAADDLRTPASSEALLFTQSSPRGTLTPTKCECDGRYILTLRDVSKRTAFFSDRPNRHAGHMRTASFTRAFSRYGFSAGAPSATLRAVDPSGRRRPIVVELTHPRYDAKRRSMRYRARSIPFQTGPLLKASPATSDIIPGRLRRVSLFIAKAKAPVIHGCLLAFAMRCGAPDLRHAQLPGIDLRYANLGSARMANANLTGAQMGHIELPAAELTAANLSGAHLRSAELSGARMRATNLTAVDLTAALMVDADLTGANLTGAQLTGSHLSGANLTDVNLTGVNLADATFTDVVYCRTTMPNGFVRNSGC